MPWNKTIQLIALAILPLIGGGCKLTRIPVDFGRLNDDGDLISLDATATEIEYTGVAQSKNEINHEEPPPLTVDDEPPTEFWDVNLEEVIAIALRENDVLNDLGGRILTAPAAVATVYDPAIRESDPLFGTEEALSDFDAQWSTGLFWENNDRVFNNEITGGGVNEFQQDLATFRTELSKVAATGSRFSVGNVTRHDANNSTQNLFPSAWDSWFELSVRQPLLQGSGVTFNRIAGPNAQPGFNSSSGVLIARVNTDISIADFENGTTEFVSEVEDAYWELYYAYRELDAAMVARDSALETWRDIEARYRQNLRGGETYNEARSRAYIYLFQDQVQDALSGTPAEGRSVGVYRAERRLRKLMGIPMRDGRLYRPSDEPPIDKDNFEWDGVLTEALARRVELRRQKWEIKARELELIAAREFTLPRLDAIATYRLRGFGDDLTGGGARFASAYKDLGAWDHQEWEGGMQMNVPIGFRKGWAAVRNAELRLARERAVLREQERQIALELADAFSEIKRAHADIRMGYNRLAATQQDLDALRAAYEADQVSVELLLESQQRLADAQTRYHRSLTDYAIGIKNLHLRKGSLLQYNGVYLDEGDWPQKAYHDAHELQQRLQPAHRPYSVTEPGVISYGTFPQRFRSPTNMPVDSEDDPGEVAPQPDVEVSPKM